MAATCICRVAQPATLSALPCSAQNEIYFHKQWFLSVVRKKKQKKTTIFCPKSKQHKFTTALSMALDSVLDSRIAGAYKNRVD